MIIKRLYVAYRTYRGINMLIINKVIVKYFFIAGKKHGLISKPKTESLVGRTIDR